MIGVDQVNQGGQALQSEATARTVIDVRESLCIPVHRPRQSAEEGFPGQEGAGEPQRPVDGPPTGNGEPLSGSE